MKRIKCLILFMAACFLIGCHSADDGQTPSENHNDELAIKEVDFGITTDPDHLSPFMATSADSRVVLFNIFEGLLKPSAEGEVLPAIAKSYTVSDDLRTYTFVIRDNVLFHNGNAVTADDVKYSLDLAVQYKLTGMDAISSVDIIDKATVAVQLKEPDSEFDYSMTTAIIPKDYADSDSHPIGTGPFQFDSYTPQQELVLVKNKTYWNPQLPKIDKFVFEIKADLNSVLLDLQAGSLNAGTLDTTLASQLDESKFDIAYANTNAVQMLCLNNDVPPLNDKLVRQAISYAVDADEIMELAHNGHAVRAASPVIPALSNGYDSALNGNYKKDIPLAKKLLEEAGYPDGFDLTISVPSSYKQHVDTAQVIVNQLKEIGIRAQIEQVDWPTWLSTVYKGRNYQSTVVSVDGVTLSPRSYLFRYVKDSTSNFINFSNAEYDQLFNGSLTETDADKRKQAYYDLQKILSDEAASVFLCDIAAPKIFAKGIKGFTPYPIYIFDASTLYFE